MDPKFPLVQAVSGRNYQAFPAVLFPNFTHSANIGDDFFGRKFSKLKWLDYKWVRALHPLGFKHFFGGNLWPQNLGENEPQCE